VATPIDITFYIPKYRCDFNKKFQKLAQENTPNMLTLFDWPYSQWNSSQKNALRPSETFQKTIHSLLNME